MEIEPETTNRKKTGKSPTTWKLNNTLINNPWDKEKNLKENLKIHRTKSKWKYNTWEYVKHS